MKKLITVKDINNSIEHGEKIIIIDSKTIITPAAIDAAREHNIVFSKEKQSKECIVKETKNLEEEVSKKLPADCGTINMDLIYKIVGEVLKESLGNMVNKSFTKESDESGLKLIRGNTVQCERFETGNPKANVGLKDILNTKESPNMGAGFMTIDKCSFDWELCYEEIDYIIEGDLDITINGRKYRGHAGDVFFIPKNSKIIWSSENHARFLYVTYPANWAELVANK